MYTEIEMLFAIMITAVVWAGICYLAMFLDERSKKKQHDYYILKMYGLIDPILMGPFELNECSEKIEAYRNDMSESQNSFTLIEVSKGAEIEL